MDGLRSMIWDADDEDAVEIKTKQFKNEEKKCKNKEKI